MREKQSGGGGFVYFSGNKHPRADRFYAGEPWQVGGDEGGGRGGLEMLFCRMQPLGFFFVCFFFFLPPCFPPPSIPEVFDCETFNRGG